MGQVSPLVATVLLVAMSVLTAMALASGIVLFVFYAVLGMFMAGQVYAGATRSRR